MEPIIIGYIATGFTISAFLPQAWKVVKTRSTRDISLPSYCLLIFTSLSWLWYGTLIGDMPILLTNVATLALQLVILTTKLRYG